MSSATVTGYQRIREEVVALGVELEVIYPLTASAVFGYNRNAQIGLLFV
jgi:hypothetical protein